MTLLQTFNDLLIYLVLWVYTKFQCGNFLESGYLEARSCKDNVKVI